MFFEMLRQASVVALFSLLVCVLPLGFGVAYAVRPTEQRLALMRPISLAGIFGSLSGFLSGLINTIRAVGVGEWTWDSRVVAIGLAETLVTLFVGFGCLTVAWLLVALGLRRHV